MERYASTFFLGRPVMNRTFYATWILLALLFCGCNFEDRLPAEMTTKNEHQSLAKEKSLNADVRMDIGSLEISGDKDASSLYNLDIDYDKGSYQPEVKYDSTLGGEEGNLLLRLESMHKIGVRADRRNNKLVLNFNNSIPLKLKVNTGVGDSRINMSGMRIARLDLESGVGGARLASYDPNSIQCESIRIKSGVGGTEAIGLGNLNFRDLEFEGGVGGATLDLTGEWKQDASIRVQVGVGGVTVKMPREIGVRVEAEKHFLSGLHLDRFSQRDAYYYSDNYDSAKVRVTIRVVTGVGGFQITWV
jgi:Cell wall-active antibiotics response LiaF, C-terminal/N-terminal domain of toast_rack, DUF2154